ncbi:MAG TPA: amidase, partial [Rhizomicrobium sp.]|nr:amidase [Rhizomicrobium sp.]
MDGMADRRTVLKMGSAAMVVSNTAMAASSSIVMMDARALSRAIAAKKVSCAEVMGAYLDHIAALNPKVNAIVALQDRDQLIAQAREHDAMLAKGQNMGVLHGFPHAVKDLQPVRGIVSTSGSPILKDFVPAQDSLVVARMRAAGAIFIGKTNVPEFGLGSHTYNPVYGATHNPYDLTKSAGGSSGGAAVGLALHMLPVADGTDYGGSLRNPAGWNNVVGFRNSYGVVPSPGEDVWVPSMSVAGAMGRSVADLALLLSTQAGFDARAPLALDGSGTRFLGPLEANFKGKRIGWLNDLGGATPYEPGVLEVCREALKSFEAIGCTVETVTPKGSVEDTWRAFVRIRQFQQGPNFRAFYNDPARRALLKPEAIYEVEGSMKLSAFDVTQAFMARTRWYNAVQALFSQFDFLVMPTSQVFAFDINDTWPHQIAGTSMQSYHEWMKATCMVTMSGCPSLAVPAGFSSAGLPMGIQIVGPMHHDMDCLKIGHAYE